MIIILLVSLSILVVYLKLKPFIKAQKGLKVASQLDFYKKYLTINHKDVYEEIMEPIIREKCDVYWTGYDFHVILHNPEDIKIVLGSENCFEKPVAYEYVFKYSLMTIGGEKYKQQRKRLNPIFAIQNLKSIISTIDKNCNKFLIENSAKITKADNEIKLILSKFTFENICETILGVESLDAKSTDEFIIDAENFVKIANDRIFKPWLYPDWTYKMSHLYKMKQKCMDWIKQIASNRKKINKDSINYFDCLADLNAKMNKHEFLDSLTFFVGASYETTAQTITNTLVLLSAHENEQNKLFNEISTILISPEDYITDDKLRKMIYLETVIKETLRLFPITLLQMRKAEDNIKLSKFVAPKGTFLVIPSREIHRDESIWGKDALEFKPERFLNENFKNIHSHAYLPFSHGARICPGYKYAMITMKIFLSKFIMKYRISTSSDFKIKDLKVQVGLSAQIQNPPKIEIHNRF